MNVRAVNRVLKKKLQKNCGLKNDAGARACRSFIESNPPDDVLRQLPGLFRNIDRRTGPQYAFNLLQRLEVLFDFRRPQLALYDHTLHLIGGAQKYGCTIAQALQDRFAVTLISNKPVTLEALQQWYHLDLSRCRIKVIPIPFFDERQKEHLDPAEINSRKIENHFHIISRESGNYDFFINNSMLEMVYPLADLSLFICHFPERKPSSYFYVERYDQLIYNSRYTAEWIQKKWHLKPGSHFYPPVDMDSGGDMAEKENIIISVARFDPGGNKQQLAMVQVFRDLLRLEPNKLKDWRLILAGGSPRDNPYLQSIKKDLELSEGPKVELKINVQAEELRHLYRQAKIFWHFCGLNQHDPALVEHFGITAVEAMQNFCVPIVFNGGGLREIIEAEVSGFLFSSKKELLQNTLLLVENPQRLTAMAGMAYRRSQIFSREIFTAKIRELFTKLLADYLLKE